MKVLVIGNGGREHAIAWQLSRSKDVSAIFVAPGNAGTLGERRTQNVPIQPTDIGQLVSFAQQQGIDLTIVGPEAPLANGIKEAFEKAKCPCFAPSQAAAQLETSKSFSKQFMQDHGIPTAKFSTFTDEKSAIAYLNTQAFPVVIKADGLAAGKGVIIAQTHDEAKTAIHAMLAEGNFGKAGEKIIIEEYLAGTELSYIVMCDGQHSLSLASAQDHKRRDNGDRGPNTGGMGAFSPSPFLTPALEKTIQDTIIQPVLDGMQALGHPYVGFLFAGLMISPEGSPKVLEFNCRLGDPEAQCILLRMRSDFATLCAAGCEGTLDTHTIDWDERVALGVVMTAGGYPTKYHVGDLIQGIPSITSDSVKVFHGGTTIKNKQLVTHGGRVLTVTALDKTLRETYELAYQSVEKIHWNNCFYRTDIGHQAIIQTMN